jgi:acetyl esterase/lipase
MIARAVVNLVMRRWLKPLWHDVPSVERVRKTYLFADRLGTLGRKRTEVQLSEAGGVAVEWIGSREAARHGVIVYLHGGGFAVRAAHADRRFCATLSRLSGRPVVLVPYRLAPEFPFPHGLQDCCKVYEGLLASGIPPHKVAFIGHSAGANYALLLLMRARQQGMPQPAGAVLLSAPTDLAAGSPSAWLNAERDSMLGPNIWRWVQHTYLGSVPPEHPGVSPLHGDWTGLAPLHFHVSDTEIILDDSRRALERATRAGNDARLSIWHDLPHNFYFIDLLEESRQCRAQILAFIGQALGRSD